VANPMAIIEELQALAAEFGLTLKGPGVKAATKAAARGGSVAAAGDVAAARALIAERLGEAGITGVRAAKPGLLAGVKSAGVSNILGKFAKGAGVAAGAAFAGGITADWLASLGEQKESTQRLGRAIEDPWAFEEAVAENYIEQETARKMEAARMLKLQELAMVNPQLLANMRSKAAGDSIPTLGPGEARIGGSAWYDPEVIDRALVNSDIWED